MRFDGGFTDIPSAGTRVQISNTRDKVVWIKFQAPAGNTGLTYVGRSDVSSTNGYVLGAAGGVDATLEIDFRPMSEILSAFYVDAATSGDDVSWAVILE